MTGAAVSRLTLTTGRFGSTTGWLSRSTGWFGCTTGWLGRTSRRTVAALASAAAAGSRGGVGDHQTDGDGTQDGKDRGKTLHEILLIEERDRLAEHPKNMLK